MADPQHTSLEGSGPAFQAWRHSVEKALKGRDFSALQTRTRDGIVIEPLYPPRMDAIPASGRDSGPWALVQIIDDPDPDRGNQQALDDIQGGATGLCLRFAGSPLAGTGGLPSSPESLAIVLDGIDLAGLHLRVDPGPLGPDLATWVRELVARRGIAPELANISFGLDPVTPVLLLPREAERENQLATTFEDLFLSGLKGPIAELDGRPFHEAGGTEALELAAILASAVWWLRALEPAGISADLALPFFGASISVDHDQFMSIAKVRALRLVWARFQELCGVPHGGLRIHAQTSRRMMTAAAPHTNLVRATIAAFAAGVAGADSLAVLPYSAPTGRPSAADRALARNTQHLLLQEAQVHRVWDAPAGSGVIEALTEALAERAWAEFQTIEREGGITDSLRSGALASRLAASRDALRREVASGAIALVGATIYRDPGEAVLAPAIASDPAGPLAPVRLEEMAAV